MSRHIDTIPVWDAYKTDCECPLCALMKKNEEDYVDNFLGASVMEPDRRVEVNEKGFCRRHFKMMFDAGNRLGLGTNLFSEEETLCESMGTEELAEQIKQTNNYYNKHFLYGKNKS